MNKLKEEAKKTIANEALSLFLKKSIVSVTIEDVAKEIGIGEATIYRYFGKKINLVMASATMLLEKIYGEAKNVKGNNGYDMIKNMYYNYYLIFHENLEYFKFIYEFDSIILKENIDKNLYEKDIDLYKELFMNSYKKGIVDGSLKEIENIEIFYYSTTHSLLNLCEKLSLNTNLLHQDSIINKEDEIKELINVFLYRIRKEGNNYEENN